MISIDTDLFASLQHPFGHYLAPDGFARIQGLKKPKARSYEIRVPEVCRLAAKMLQAIPNRGEWGQQIPDDWVTETVFGNVPTKRDGSRNRYGFPLRLRDVVKHLMGRTFAIGNTDRDCDAWATIPTSWAGFFGHPPGFWRVRTLRVETDQGGPWRARHRAPILAQLRAERRAAHALGLWYRAYRSAGRGTHAVLPLPFPVTLRLAHWMEWAYRTVLGPYAHPSAALDKSNLKQIMRLPGGLHATRGNLGLGMWINVDTEALYEMDVQALLMAHGFTSLPSPLPQNAWGTLLTRTEFRDAACELDAVLEGMNVGHADAVTPAVAQSLVLALPNNALASRLRDAAPRIIMAVPDPEAPSDGVPAARAGRLETTETERAWAARIWATGYTAGGFWHWINGGGDYGIRAAYVLFGPEQFAAELSRQAEEMPYSTPGTVAERRKTIKGLCATYRHRSWGGYKKVETISGEVSDDIVALASIVRHAVAAQPRVRQAILDDIERLAQLLLVGLRQSETGVVEASYQMIADSVAERWPEAGNWSRIRASRLMNRLTEGDPKCGFGLVRAVRSDHYGQVTANHYRMGTDLITLVGESHLITLMGGNKGVSL